MNFCVNCGVPYSLQSGVCLNCSHDQLVPQELIEARLKKNKFKSSLDTPHFGYPGEKIALILSCLLAIGVTVFLGLISYGLFFILIVIGLIQLKIQHISLTKNNILVSKKQFADVFSLSQIAAYRLNIFLPDVYIYNHSELNAYTMGFYRYGFIVISSEMVKYFTAEELLFVIGHEMGHIKKYHTTLLSLLNPSKTGLTQSISATVLKTTFNIWSVKAEYTADQGGVIACQNLRAAISALLKMAGGPDIEREVDLELLHNSKDDKRENNWSQVLEYLGTHPYISNRVQQLKDFRKHL